MIKLIITNFTDWDTRLFNRIFGWHGKQVLDRTMVLFTRSADGYLFPVMAGVLLLLEPASSKPFLLTGILAFAIELTAHHFLKRGIRRDRPFNAIIGIECLLQPPDKFSFPSGHTAAAFVMASLLASFFPFTAMTMFVWAMMVGLSRIYLGLHYPTDVLAGALLGIGSTKIALGIIQNLTF